MCNLAQVICRFKISSHQKGVFLCRKFSSWVPYVCSHIVYLQVEMKKARINPHEIDSDTDVAYTNVVEIFDPST